MTARRLSTVAACAAAWLSVGAMPASAATVRLTPVVIDAAGDATRERGHFLSYELALPRGARLHQAGSLARWTRTSRAGGRTCRTLVYAVAALAPRPPVLEDVSRRRRDTVVLTRRDGTAQQLPFTREFGRFRLDDDDPSFAFLAGSPRLPDGVAPALRERFAFLAVVAFLSRPCPRAARRAALATMRAAFASWRLRVVGDYVPPPPDLPPPTADLATAPALRIGGFARRGGGLTVAGVGDFDGDGWTDVATGSFSRSARVGAATVIAARGGSRTTLGRLPTREMLARLSLSTAAVAGLGDLDGDGRAEVAVGSPSHDLPPIGGPGVVSVVLGRAGAQHVDLDRRRSRVVRITSGARCPMLGSDVANVGDVDGRGKPDLAVVAGPLCGRSHGGRVFVVFGESLVRDLDPLRMGGRGFEIEMGLWGFDAPRVAAAGDVNRDGLADLVVGAADAHDQDPQGARGAAFVVYGTRSPRRVRLARLGPGGFEIRGGRCDDAGRSVAGVGDVDGDGYDDIGVGAPHSCGDVPAGRVYLVRGGARARLVRLDRPGAAVRILGPRKAGVGEAVAAAGDRNGDGLADVVIGAPEYSYRGRREAGAAFVVHGSRSLPRSLELRRLGAGGERYVGPVAGARLGAAVGPAGDLDADGIPDLVLGAPGEWRAPPAAVYVTRGRP